MKGWQQGNIRSRYQMGICGIILMMILLAGCSQTGSGSATATENNGQPTTQVSTTGEASGTHEYTDYKGNTMQIPVHPQRIISIGGDVGDLLALGVEPIGASLQVIKDQVVYKDRLQGIADVGEPVDPEKVAALAPDLILVDGSGLYDEIYPSLTKIAPVVLLERTETYERLRTTADVIGKPDAAEQWIKDYEARAQKVISNLNIPKGATATAFLQIGKDMYVMGDNGLSSTLYHILQFKPNGGVQKLIDQKESFAQIAGESLPDYAGDWLFILHDDTDISNTSVQSMLDSAIWKTVPAVKEGHVYTLASEWNFDDPITRDMLLDQLPTIMKK
ncbi:ABC transporter substrate-binding protein [Paenibacillus kandeliae]|uniref:ABC transporter substrate-binding protein n=1 Tax=Paenibacillus kandeliae TaxID=3231269 RepID=UPI0034581A41